MSPLPVFEIILMSTWPVCRDRHVLREFRRKISEFFSCVAFLLCVVDDMFTKVPLFKDNALPWEYRSSAPELHNHQGHDQISVSYCDSKKFLFKNIDHLQVKGRAMATIFEPSFVNIRIFYIYHDLHGTQ